MSKIGNVNLELQEQANRLGFSTVQEALDAGYGVLEDMLVKIDDGQTKAHKAWLEEKHTLMKKLVDARDYLASYGLGVNEKTDDAAAIALIIDEAIKFIEGVKYEQ